jgi:hypothetical protein
MQFNDALQAMLAGKYVARAAWDAEAKYCVIMPGMTFMWLIQTIPNPNAGVWMGMVADLLADDWKVIEKIESPKPVEAPAAA